MPRALTSLLALFLPRSLRSSLPPRLPLPLLSLLPLSGLACASPSLPDPKEAVQVYADAAARGDADAIYGMLSDKSRTAMSRDEVRRRVAEARAELAEQARSVTAPGVVVKTRARVRYPDGEIATLELDERERAFRISAADALPAGGRTPEQALEQLRRVLARRSYAGLLRVLTPATRAAIESDLRSLVEGLAQPEGLEVRIAGDSATVQIPGGHEVKLRREAGVWRVEDFD
ncbi:hypothetical protein predicted by Glimmer/Critica [Sorangium cellulosum So ce56]|uniref:Secreted protein n=1 Tax=Sorangium cellulosum (strain So ce56) TaxID=448385 RepID=A9G2S4_SORC5|nr:hypothetical protein [Sorangium cellulosum]CAN95682.1 hypothetical protein predicted by Glimmer/Critica [Sorangium cellulosum So ce56]